MKDGTWSKNGPDEADDPDCEVGKIEAGSPKIVIGKYVREFTEEELTWVMGGLAALRRDMRSEAGSLLVMFRVLKPEEKGAMVEKADKLIEQSNKVNDLMERLLMR